MNSHDLFREVLRFVRVVCPGEKCEAIHLKLGRGTIKLQPPLAGLSDAEIPVVKPAKVPMPIPKKFHPVQVGILKALAGGKVLKGEALVAAAKVGCRADLFRKGHGIKELRAMGLVDSEKGSGYFLTDKGEEVAEGV